VFGFQLLVQQKLDHGSRLVLVVDKHRSQPPTSVSSNVSMNLSALTIGSINF
jgi:hypothetical protein